MNVTERTHIFMQSYLTLIACEIELVIDGGYYLVLTRMVLWQWHDDTVAV